MSSRPKNKEEYRKEMADAFANVLEEKGLNWKKEWHRHHIEPDILQTVYLEKRLWLEL